MLVQRGPCGSMPAGILFGRRKPGNGKVGSIKEAPTRFWSREAYDMNVLAFGGDVTKLCKEGRLEAAIQAIELMHEHGLPVLRDIINSLLQCCMKKKDHGACTRVYSLMVSSSMDSITFVADHFIRMFASCGSLQEANQVFYRVSEPSSYTWNSIISAHIKLGDSNKALELYSRMQHEHVQANKVTFLAILKACSSTQAIQQGRLIHEQIIHDRLESDIMVGSSLIDMYAKCGSFEEGQKMFKLLPTRNVVSWNTMLAAYVQHASGIEAFHLLEKMWDEGIMPNRVTFTCILRACGSMGAIEQGKMIHDQIIRSGLQSDASVGNTLVDMYAKCGNTAECQKVFETLPNQDVVSWNALMSGYVHDGKGLHALEFFKLMQKKGISPDKITFLCILQACGSSGAMMQAKLIHKQIVENGLELDVAIGNALVDMYARCGSVDDGRNVFDKLLGRDVVSWNAMIASYAVQGNGFLALSLFEDMHREHIKPVKITFFCTLKACGSIGALAQGRLIHNQIIRNEIESDTVIGNNMVDFYARCGSIEDASNVFTKLPYKDVVSWNVMIGGYARVGNLSLARECLTHMVQQGLKPDATTFTSILTACSHACEVEEGNKHFKSMTENYGIVPSIEHFTCLACLLARAGCLNETQVFLQSAPLPPHITGWRSLLSACRMYGDMEVGRQCFDQAIQLDPDNAIGYVLMSNIYADAQMGEEALEIQEIRRDGSAWKKPGVAWVEVDDKAHEFTIGRPTGQENDKINDKLKRITSSVKKKGYLPQLDLVLAGAARKDALYGQ